jgi:hypothetical protein
MLTTLLPALAGDSGEVLGCCLRSSLDITVGYEVCSSVQYHWMSPLQGRRHGCVSPKALEITFRVHNMEFH